MKLRVERDVLAEAVTWTARALPSRSPVPVLTGLLLDAEAEGVLRLSSFDYEISARIEAPAEVLDGGTVLVSGKLLADICRSLPGRPVDLTTDGSRVSLVCGASRFTLLTMPVEDYPTLPAMPDGSGSIAGDVFSQAVAQVSVAASREDSPPMLAGVRMEIDGSDLTLLATDRYRLAMRTIPWRPAAPDASAVALVRARTLSEVSKTLGAGGDVTLALSRSGENGLIGFEAGGRRTTSLLMDGEYPRVRSLFPAESPTYAVLEVQSLIEAVRRVSLVVERHTAVRLGFTEGALTLEGGQGEDAQASEAIEATLVGEEISIGFNPQYLLDGLAALGTPFVRLSLTASNKPAVITGRAEPDGADDDSYRYLLMPMRL
ncbi:MAG TPA: DNA polymerase III subunit beta [Kineosporiaceae bacterium]